MTLVADGGITEAASGGGQQHRIDRRTDARRELLRAINAIRLLEAHLVKHNVPLLEWKPE